MCAVTTWPFFSFIRKVVLGRVSTTSPSIWIASSLDIPPLPAWGRELEHKARSPGNLRRSEEHTSELQSPCNLVCRLLLEKKTHPILIKLNHPQSRDC